MMNNRNGVFLAIAVWMTLFSFNQCRPCHGDPAKQGSTSPAFSLATGRLIAQANDYYTHGDLDSAERTWAQARAQLPTLPDPPWRRRNLVAPVIAAQERAKPEILRNLLEEQIRKHPGDAEARRQLLLIAEESGDSQAIFRHRSVLEGPSDPGTSIVGKIIEGLACILLLVLAVWQGWKLYRELSPRS